MCLLVTPAALLCLAAFALLVVNPWIPALPSSVRWHQLAGQPIPRPIWQQAPAGYAIALMVTGALVFVLGQAAWRAWQALFGRRADRLLGKGALTVALVLVGSAFIVAVIATVTRVLTGDADPGAGLRMVATAAPLLIAGYALARARRRG